MKAIIRIVGQIVFWVVSLFLFSLIIVLMEMKLGLTGVIPTLIVGFILLIPTKKIYNLVFKGREQPEREKEVQELKALSPKINKPKERRIENRKFGIIYYTYEPIEDEPIEDEPKSKCPSEKLLNHMGLCDSRVLSLIEG